MSDGHDEWEGLGVNHPPAPKRQLQVKWQKADEQGVIRSNVPGLEIEKDTFHDGERQRIEYLITVGEEWPIVRARTMAQAKGFVQGLANLLGSADD